MCKLFMERRSLDHLVPHRRYGGPVMVNLCRIITGLAFVLFFFHTLIPRMDGRSMTFIDGETQTQGSEQPNFHDRNLLPALQTNSSETRAQADTIACKKAEQLYEAAAEDARTLERAIFISAFRREVERALSRRMTDEELRTLADEARTEAHRWYKFIQSDPRCAASWHGELNSPQLGSRRIVAMIEIGTFRSTTAGPAGMTAIYKGVPPSHSRLST
jgi:hypothetical protein